MDEDAVSLFQVAGGAATLTLAGKEYAVRTLALGDIAATQKYMISGRINTFLDACGDRRFPMPEERIALTLANIASATVSLGQMLSDEVAEGYMLSLSLGLPHATVMKLPSLERRILNDVMGYISKIREVPTTEPETGRPDPTDTTGGTSTAPSDGTNSCPASATTSK